MTVPLLDNEKVLQWQTFTKSPCPASTLPAELLMQIFTAGMQYSTVNDSEEDIPYKNVAHQDSTLNVPFEIVVSQVCTSWRALAHATPRLWRTILCDTTSRRDCLLAYLDRSIGTLLDLDITCAGYSSDLDTEVLDRLFARSQAWWRCTITLATETPTSPVLTRLRGLTAPNLRYLSVTLHEAQRGVAPDSVILGGGLGCPRLDFLRLRGVALRFFIPPLEHITTLHYDQTRHDQLAYERFREILLSIRMLKHLSLYGNIIGATPWPPRTEETVINLPDLLSLRICGASGYVYSGVLLNIDAPCLSSLTLKDLADPDLLPLFSSSKCYRGVRSLTLCDIDYPVEDTYRSLAKLFPNVQELNFLNSVFQAPKVLTYLADTAGGGVQWTQLANLTIVLNFEENGKLKKVLQRRIKARYPLARLRVMMRDRLFEIHDYEWVGRHVQLEMVDTFPDTWPPDRDFEDDDDFLVR